MTIFNNKYRIESNRLKGWDYSKPGYYFITICTKNREKLFGQIHDCEIKFTDIGKIVQNEWLKSFEIRKELECNAYIIMPNHIHAVIEIIEQNSAINVETSGRTSLHDSKLIKPKSLSSFTAGFKSASTKRINEYRKTPGKTVWQSRYYDRIIRTKKELQQICKYISENPGNWYNDDLNIKSALME